MTPQERFPTGIRPGTFLFNIYISELPTTVPRKYVYANDPAIMYTGGDWQTVEGVLSKDMGKRKWMPPYLDVKAWYYKSSVGSRTVVRKSSIRGIYVLQGELTF